MCWGWVSLCVSPHVSPASITPCVDACFSSLGHRSMKKNLCAVPTHPRPVRQTRPLQKTYSGPSAAIRGTEPRDDGTPLSPVAVTHRSTPHTRLIQGPNPSLLQREMSGEKHVCGHAREHVRVPRPETRLESETSHCRSDWLPARVQHQH